jgi:Ribbon-helix-helix protein, copG family.
MPTVERTQISLDAAQASRLRRLARERGTSMAALIRAAVDRAYPVDDNSSLDARWERAIAAVGGFHGNGSNVGEEHDRYLEEAYLDWRR